MPDRTSSANLDGASSLDVVARAQRGDVEAIGRLYSEHYEALFRYLCLRVPEPAAAEDLTGDVFVRMLAALPQYRPSEAPFRAWLYRIARNLVIDHYRKNGKRVALPLDEAHDQPGEDEEPEVAVDLNLSFDRVRHALERLEDLQREVVSLRFLSGFSLQEVAVALDKSEHAVKALQHRGLAALRRALVQEQVAA